MVDAVIVAPHLDDAALSCGGTIARLVRGGKAVTVVTAFTADQPADSPLSALARRSHASWGIGDQPFAIRRDEDRAALGLLGAQAEHLGLLDAIYRRASADAPLYADPLGSPEASDAEQIVPQLVEALQDSALGANPGARVFCPLAVGGHVDHILMKQAVERVADPARLVYYSEYPYSARPATAEVGDGPPRASLDAAGAPGDLPALIEETLPLTDEELAARIAAIGCYASQLRGLFPSRAERVREIASARLPIVGWALERPADIEASRKRMAAAVRRDVARLGGERYWWPAATGSPFGR